MVELARLSPRNPPIPADLRLGYDWAMGELLLAPLRKETAVWDARLIPYYAALLAASKGYSILATAYQELDADQARRFLADFFGGPSWLERE